MLLVLSFLFVAGVCALAVRMASKTFQETQDILSVLESEIERHTDDVAVARSAEEATAMGDDWSLPIGHDPKSQRRDIVSLVDEVFQEGSWEVSRAAVSELLSIVVVKKSHLSAMGRGLLRAPFLAAVAGSIVILSAVGIGGASWPWVLTAVALAIVTTLLCQVVLGRTRKLLRRFEGMCEVLERELEKARRDRLNEPFHCAPEGL